MFDCVQSVVQLMFEMFNLLKYKEMKTKNKNHKNNYAIKNFYYVY